MEYSNKERKWILIVDDDREIRELIRSVIKSNFSDEVRVVEAVDGVEATYKINQQRFHCIITDMEMPKKEGNSFISSVRLNNFNNLTPVIVLSGVVEQDVESRFPFVYFVSKPFEPEYLVNLIKKQIETGSTKDKLSAGVFNDLITYTTEFFDKIIEPGIVVVGQASKKASHTPVETDYVSVMSVKIGQVNNIFSIISNEKDFAKLVSLMKHEYSELEKTYKSMSYVILKNVLLKNKMSNDPLFIKSPITYDKEILNNVQGVIIPLSIKGIELKLFASVTPN